MTAAPTDRGIHEQPAAEVGERSHQRTLHGAAGQGVEIGDVPLVAVEGVAVGARQGEGVTRGAAGNEARTDGCIRLTPAAVRQDRPAGAQVEHGNHAQ